MLKNLFNIFLLTILNFYVLNESKSIDVEQLYLDFEIIGIGSSFEIISIYFLVGLCVAFLNITLIFFFKPFIEIYLLHYVRYSFYLLINLLSLATIFLTLRIYGYSRFLILVYLILSTLVFVFSDKNYFLKRM
jgi:hypothetical protein